MQAEERSCGMVRQSQPAPRSTSPSPTLDADPPPPRAAMARNAPNHTAPLASLARFGSVRFGSARHGRIPNRIEWNGIETSHRPVGFMRDGRMEERGGGADEGCDMIGVTVRCCGFPPLFLSLSARHQRRVTTEVSHLTTPHMDMGRRRREPLGRLHFCTATRLACLLCSRCP